MKYSVVIPVHNEARILPITLPTVLKFEPDEIVIVFDRCTDKSYEVARKIIRDHGFLDRFTPVFKRKPAPDWNHQLAHTRHIGFERAKYDRILNVSSDFFLKDDPRKYLHLLGKNRIGMITYRYMDYTIFNFSSIPANILGRISKFLPIMEPFTGMYAVYKPYWKAVGGFSKEITGCEDTYIYNALKRAGFKIIYAHDVSYYNTRVKHYPERIFNIGFQYWKILRAPLWKAILRSVVRGRPHFLKGYLAARYSELR